MEPNKKPIIKIIEQPAGVSPLMPRIIYEDETRMVVTHLLWRGGVPSVLMAQCKYKPVGDDKGGVISPEFFHLSQCNYFTHWPAEDAKPEVPAQKEHQRTDEKTGERVIKPAVAAVPSQPATPTQMEFRAGGLTAYIPMEYDDYLKLMSVIAIGK